MTFLPFFPMFEKGGLVKMKGGVNCSNPFCHLKIIEEPFIFVKMPSSSVKCRAGSET